MKKRLHIHSIIRYHLKRINRIKNIKYKHIILIIKSIFWFSTGITLSLFFLTSFAFIIFENTYSHKVYPGITINGIAFGGKTEIEVIRYFTQKNETIQNSILTFTSYDKIATMSAKELQIGYDSGLLGKQASSIGRSSSLLSNSML